MKKKKTRAINKRRESLKNFVKPFIFKFVKNCIKIYDLYNYLLFRYLINIKKYKRLTDNLINGIFEIFIISEGGIKEVIKIPKRSNPESFIFYSKIIRKKEFEKYSKTLVSLKDLPYLKEHIIEPIKINRNGGYKSHYIEGFNLRVLRDQVLYDNFNFEDSFSLKIISNINKLIKHLEEYYHKFKYIPGDWPLHNLIYDESNDRIVNVDLEGFYTYKRDNLENNLEYIKRNLSEVVNLLNKENKDDQIKLSKVLDAIESTTSRNEVYNAKGFESAYQSIKLKGKYFRGQREIASRFKNLDYNFKNKVVLDLGCNIGGMLHMLSDKIKFGVGIDFYPRCINAANLIKDFNKEDNLGFYNLDLEKDNLYLIKNFLQSEKVDICFLLSACMWIKNWKEVIDFCSKISKDLLFESNGSERQQEKQVDFLKEKYFEVILLDSKSDDDPLQKNRKLYLCRN